MWAVKSVWGAGSGRLLISLVQNVWYCFIIMLHNKYTCTHNSQHTHSSHILPTALSLRGWFQSVAQACPKTPSALCNSVYLMTKSLFFFFPLLSPESFSPSFFSSFLCPPLFFPSFLQFTPASFSPPSTFPPGSLPLSKLQRSPLSLCLREFNQTVKPRISSLIHRACLVSDANFAADQIHSFSLLCVCLPVLEMVHSFHSHTSCQSFVEAVIVVVA